MATAYTTIGSKFQPYTLAEMLVPYQTYKQEFDKREELYNTYAENAGLIGSQLDDTLDKDLMDTVYNPYMQELNQAAATLSSKGLSSENRKTLQNLRRRFGSDIAPIKVATEARAEARKNWDKLSSQDRTLMTNANPYYQAVSNYMNGKSPETYYVSGNELYGRGKALAEAFSRTLRDVPEGEALASTLGGQYYRITKQYGPDSKQMQDFMNNVADSIPELRSQIEDILNNTDIGKQGFTQEDRNKAEQYIIEGMKAGLSGKTDVQYLQNRNWDLIQADRRRKQEETPTVPKLPTFMSNMGHEGNGDKLSDVDKFAQTLTLRNGKTLSNPELDALLAKYQKDLKTIRDIEDKYGKYTETSFTSTGSFIDYGKAYIPEVPATSTPKNKYFIKDGKKTYLGDLSKEELAAFTKARSNMSNGSKRMQEIQNELDSLAERYSYIPGDNILQSIQLGVALEKAQATREKSGIIPRVTPTEQKNSVDAILNGVRSSLGSGESQTKGLIDLETNKFISKSDIDKLFKDNQTEGRFRIIATDSEPVVIHDTDTGKSYAPSGSISEIDNYRNRYTATNNYLKDYSNSETGISNRNAELSEFSLKMLENTGMMPIQGGVNLGNGYYGYTTYTTDGDVIKVVVEADPRTGYGRLLGTSSLRDEINGGLIRGSFMKDAASGFLYDIFVTNKR